jgi:23S rRNA pseudouridine955/2504/2580 synthase
MAAMEDLLINSAENGLTCLEILKRRISAAPDGYLAQLLRKGKILLEQEPVAAETVLHAGDRLTLPDSDRLQKLQMTSQQATIEILLENPLWMVVFKPPGIAVHRGAGHETDNLTGRVGLWLKNRGDPFRAAPVHRLDVGTSGPVLFAKGRRAAGALGKALMAGAMEKTYLALATGSLRDDRSAENPAEPFSREHEGEINLPVPAKGKLKEATTRYRVLSGTSAFTLLQLDLLSGRTHQIRRHLADSGHPLAGDRRYGGPSLPGLTRPFLHCLRLVWPDPLSQIRQHVTCPLPEDLKKVLAVAGLNVPY